MWNPFRHWRDKPHECPRCGWQGLRPITDEVFCPECGCNLWRRTWLETWGLTLLILGVVVAVVLFVAYFGNG
ncbi:MAG: hypothetical protein HYX68_20475 [Planctomycetes bacterium]|nr:hypothetical protein [Planctomycetota bacterium]